MAVGGMERREDSMRKQRRDRTKRRSERRGGWEI